MAQDSVKPVSVTRVSEIQDARIQITAEKRLQVEFRIEDLIKKLVPPGGIGPRANCNGCHGCQGCNM